MGEVTKRENEWQDRATAAAIGAARRIVLGDAAVIPMMTPIGRLSDVEWGWIVAAIIFAWVATRAEQATTERLDPEAACRIGIDMAWNDGAIAAILPQLATDLAKAEIDCAKPLGEWPREQIIRFLGIALALAQLALAARDSAGSITSKPEAVLAR